MHTLYDLAQVITKVEHPFISYSLTELGIVTDIDLEDDTVSLEFAWPFPKIPIRDELVNSIAKVTSDLGFKLTFTERIMTPEEKSYFMMLEKKGWKNKEKK
jgi:metal-sulfur cluster biosynthetic enzyme